MLSMGMPAERILPVPTLLRIGPYRLFVYSSDWREPPHVHVSRERFRAKIWISPVRLAWNDRFRSRELRRVIRLITDNEEHLLRAWRAYFTR
jgi:hypothetical protein